MGHRLDIDIFDLPDGSRVIEAYDRRQGDLKRRNKAVKRGKVSHEDKAKAKNLVKRNDPDSWQRLRNGEAGSNPDIILDRDTGSIIFRPVKRDGEVVGEEIWTNVGKDAMPDDLYDRLRHARFMTDSDPLVSVLSGLIVGEPHSRQVLEAVEDAVEQLYDVQSDKAVRLEVADCVIAIGLHKDGVRVRVILPRFTEFDDVRV
ncbi:hypothetical protein G3N96_17010 [Burkholderia sp. Se-20373]|uniref:hypothetical protein n=1 Tax=Burkholderia sp. Se-20373 TaxID=2703898 RepID=UPI001982720E|nr:hypothetical protein [Burkholderia sp. Se-20373]MBN3747118.1 hypothetical protein [Burkholderia sp. Se-20373]